MKAPEYDVVVLGSGFAGSLTAMILQRVGRRVVLIDKSRHPRFAIGESSTPIANMVLHDLAIRYDTPRLLPLVKYGTWQASYPQIACGLKRGFSYFLHRPKQAFTPSESHANELLVAASSDDRDSDTQWLRSDVDHFFTTEAAAMGVTVLEDCAIDDIQHRGVGDWEVTCRKEEQPLMVRGAFVVDATGEAGVLPRSLAIDSSGHSFKTRSRAIFSHFKDVGSWQEQLRKLGANNRDHPFHCDNAAQHHIFDGGWLWMLRFDDGLTSAGLVLDESKHPFERSVDAESEWLQWLSKYPSIAAMFDHAELAPVPGRIIQTHRLQRSWSQIAGEDWALLPHTAGFVDPLHSTGIAHSLCGVEQLVRILDEHWQADTRAQALSDYGNIVSQELDLIDELVATCFATFERFDLFVIATMLYFAAATTYERLRCEGEQQLAFLCSDRKVVRDLLISACTRIRHESNNATPRAIESVREEISQLIAPINHVGLLDQTVANMYRHTVAPM